MKRPRAPLFLARTPYRRRRLRDAARLLPVVGAVLLVLPALWSPPGTGGRNLATDSIYFFLLWGLLIGIAAAFAPGLSRPDGGSAATAEDDEDPD
jgi:hypothetical protein